MHGIEGGKSLELAWAELEARSYGAAAVQVGRFYRQLPQRAELKMDRY